MFSLPKSCSFFLLFFFWLFYWKISGNFKSCRPEKHTHIRHCFHLYHFEHQRVKKYKHNQHSGMHVERRKAMMCGRIFQFHIWRQCQPTPNRNILYYPLKISTMLHSLWSTNEFPLDCGSAFCCLECEQNNNRVCAINNGNFFSKRSGNAFFSFADFFLEIFHKRCE